MPDGCEMHRDQEQRMSDELTELLIKYLEGITSFAQLQESVGELTPEEEALLASIDWEAEPTPEELAFLGEDFLQNLIAKAEAQEKELES